MTTLTAPDRTTLLAPCSCGHTINDHGSLVACWACEDGGRTCGTTFEDLLSARIEQIVQRHLNAAADAIEAAERDGFVLPSSAYDDAARIVRNLAGGVS